MIPSQVDIDLMMKIIYQTGICQVCDTQVAVYTDPESRIQISGSFTSVSTKPRWCQEEPCN
ncbi:MAG: hypothetical protein CVV33_06295 [Methanomicrobiales archaeon HGW-Methanomicrobiales-4]|nr:MAG: hypothetical protein CVV33_06295 [Methanomicrobiales archaeon HGW-Methanomicrobiales-4]